MIYQAILKIRGKEIPILYYNYRCHIQHYDDSNLRRIIQLHIQVCEEIGNRENLPVEGDLITLAFECSGDEAFFYDWLNEGMMQDGEIHFIYNEVEVADIFRFWDCYCVKIEEYMSIGNAPMMMVVYLSPGIIKRNNLEVREKVWKVSNGSINITQKANSKSKKNDNNFCRKEEVNIPKDTVIDENLDRNKLIIQSKDAWKRAEKIATLLPKSNSTRTICSDGIVTVSGYSTKRISNKFRQQVKNVKDVPVLQIINGANSLEHVLHENPFLDNGVAGSGSASHAEKQMLVIQKEEVAIGVSRTMCKCCLKFIQKVATDSGRTIYVTTPPGITLEFSPDSDNPNIIITE